MPIYNIEGEKLTTIKQVKFKKEKELQNLTEKNLEKLFNLKFVATEFQVDDLRIDTLAFNEETKSFVIIEFKNVKQSSIIDQGYTYLSLLLNNKAEFVLKYNLVFGTNFSKEDFDFTQTSVMFISPKYTTYQLRSVEFSDIPFELWKVAKYSNGTVLFDKVNNTNTTASIKQITKENSDKAKVNKEIKKYTEDDFLNGKSDDVTLLYNNFKEFLMENYDDIESSKIYFCQVCSKFIIDREEHLNNYYGHPIKNINNIFQKTEEENYNYYEIKLDNYINGKNTNNESVWSIIFSNFITKFNRKF